MNEQVVLLDEDGNAIGAADKAEVHGTDTPLHLAFSVYVFDADGRFLLTQRALAKPTFGGVWTNSCCGHPAPGEPIDDAVLPAHRAGARSGPRRADPRAAGVPLPRRRGGRALRRHGRERDVPGLRGHAGRRRRDPDPTEVEAWEWVDWPQFRDDVLDRPPRRSAGGAASRWRRCPRTR